MSIYFAPKHVLEYKWIALANMNKSFDEIKGFLKFSVNLVAVGDDQVTLNDEKPSKKVSNEDIASRVMMPPQIQTKPQQMKIQLLRAEHLIKMDSLLGSIDCFLIFEFGSSKFTTEIIKDNRNPVWGKNIYVIIFYLKYNILCFLFQF